MSHPVIAVAVVLFVGLASAPADAAKVLVVPADVAVEAGVRAGVRGVADVEVADAAAVAALMEGAKSAGIACVADDGACWLRLAALGGLDHVVFVTGDTVTHVTAKETTSSMSLGKTEANFAAACRRAFGLESAVRITASPAGVAVTLDNKAVAPAVGAAYVVEGVVPGAHVVGGSAVGFVPQLTTVTVPAGSVTDVNIALVVEAVAATPVSALTIVGGVVGGLGAVVGLGASAIALGNEASAGPASGTKETGNCGSAPGDLSDRQLSVCEGNKPVWLTAIAGGVVAAIGGGIVGFSLLE